MKRLFAITLLVLLIPAAAWAPTGGAGFGFPTFYLFDSGTTLAPLSSGYNLAIGGTDSNAPAYITSTGDTQFRGPLADVRTYASFASAITSISTTATTLLIPSAQTVSTDVTVPSNIELMFTQNGSLAIDTGMTVTINGPQDAGLHQIYSGSGSVSFGDGYIKEVYPQWWGAVGDGTTDDSTPAQSSITAAATGPIPIYFPSGTYIISTQLTVTSDNMYLYGDGDLSILKMKANTDANILYAYGTTTTYINNFRVSNLTFDGNRLNQTTEGTTRIGVHVRYADGVNIKDNRFINAGWDTASANAIGKAVQIENVTNTRILDNYFYDNHMAIAVAEGSNITPSIVIPTDLVADLLISGNYIDGNISAHAGTSPWAVDQISLQIKSATVVSNNIIKNVSNNFMGIFVSAASGAGAGERAVISNNSFYNIGGVAIESDSSASLPGGLYYSITSNYIDSTGQHGIANFGNAVISNNTILNTYDGVQTGGYGISGGASDLLISGNLIADYRDTTKMVSGVFILPTDDNTSTNIKVSDNIIRGSTGSSINITTTDTGTTTRITRVSVTNNMTIGAIAMKAQTSTNVNGVDNAIVSGNISSAYAGPNGTDNVSVFNNNFGGVGPYSTTIPTANGAFEGQFVKNSTPANPGSSPGAGMATGWRYATADTSWMPLFAHPNNVAPANSGSDCSQGMLAEDDSYIYICISDNRWERVGIAGW